MPKLEEVLIDRLTLRPEVREKARALLRTVHSKTGPGTGYEIGEAKTGLPAICAYLASKSAGYADITQDVAQKASCLAPKAFASTLKTVKTALRASRTPNASPSKSSHEADPTAYATLISEHKIGQPLRVESWMKEAQAALTALPRFRQDFASRLTESGPEVRIAVFFWVCRAIKLSTVQYTSLVDKHGISLKVFCLLVKTMEDDCVDLKESIRVTVRDMRKKKASNNNSNTAEAASSSKTPTSSSAGGGGTPSHSQPHSRSASPTKSALRSASKTTPSSLAPSRSRSRGRGSGSGTTKKRKVAFSLSEVSASEDDDGVFKLEFAPPETPSKRPRTTTTTTTPRRTAAAARAMPVSKAASGSVSSEAEDSEDVEMRDAPPPPPPRFVVSEQQQQQQPVAGPSTPRRPARATPTHAYRTPPSTRIQMLSLLSADEQDDEAAEEEEEEKAAPTRDDAEVSDDGGDDALPLSRRFRPVFLDRAQWALRAPRLARDRAAAERRTRELVERWGHPFEVLWHDATSGAASV